MNITEKANHTLAMRDSAHDVQDALNTVISALISATGKPSEEEAREFEMAAADLLSTIRR